MKQVLRCVVTIMLITSLCMMSFCDKVIKLDVLRIAIDEDSVMESYAYGTFDISTVKLDVTYRDGSTTSLHINCSMVADTDIANLKSQGTHIVTVTYEGRVVTFTVVIDPPLSETLSLIHQLGVEAGVIDLTYEEWLESIRGEDGREIVLQVSSGFIQWRHVGDQNWNNLIEMSSLVGPKGSDGQTPSIGDHGTWVIGGTDTGIQVQGPKGEDGSGVLIKGIVMTHDDLPDASVKGELYLVREDGSGHMSNGDGTWEDIGTILVPFDQDIRDHVDQVLPFIHRSKNLFDKTLELTDGFVISPGTVSTDGAYAAYKTSDFILLPEEGTYVISAESQSTRIGLALFGMDNLYLEGSAQNVSPTGTGVTVTVEQACYVRISFRSSDLDTLQIEKGTERTDYEPFGAFILQEFILDFDPALLTEDHIKTIVLEDMYDVRLDLDDGNITLTSAFDENRMIRIRATLNSKNGIFNYLNTSIASKGQDNYTSIHNNSDDIAPIRTYTTVGANHGYALPAITTQGSHGKTILDVGSIWTDGTTTFTLLKIESDNILVFGRDYSLDSRGIVNGYLGGVPDGSTMIHVSNAVNQDDIAVTEVSWAQLYPSVNNVTTEIYVDGLRVSEDETSHGDVIKVMETYDVMDYKDLLDTVRAEPGLDHARDQIDGIVRITITYEFRKGLNQTVTSTFRALKDVNIGNCGFVQAVIPQLTGHSPFRYLPHVKENEGYDFSYLTDISTYDISLSFRRSADLLEEGRLPDRIVSWLIDDATSKKNIGFVMGYLPDKSDTRDDVRAHNVNDMLWDLRSTRKMYPVALGGGGMALDQGDYFSVIAYRNYLSSDNQSETLTDAYTVRSGNDLYVFIDTHENNNFESWKVPDFVGFNVSVVDMSDNFMLHSDEIIGEEGILFSSSVSPCEPYAYVILKLN